jgi:hypothetical protein
VSAAGLAMLVGAVMFGHDALGETGEVIFTLLGSGLVAFGHIFNIKLRKAHTYNSPIELNS